MDSIGYRPSADVQPHATPLGAPKAPPPHAVPPTQSALNAQTSQAMAHKALTQTCAKASTSFLGRITGSLGSAKPLTQADAFGADVAAATGLERRASPEQVHVDVKPVAPEFAARFQQLHGGTSATGLPTHGAASTPIVTAAETHGAIDKASADDARAFIAAKQFGPLAGLDVEGPHVYVATGTAVIKMSREQVKAAMDSGQLVPGSVLARALVAHEAAQANGLKPEATRALMRSFVTMVNQGATPRQAEDQVRQAIEAAVQVEAYATHANGLMADLAKVRSFTADAMAADSAGSNLSAIRNRTVDHETVQQHQNALDSGLEAFTTAFAEARADGDYERAAKALQGFVDTAATVGETSFWRNRQSTIGQVVGQGRSLSAVALKTGDFTFAATLGRTPMSIDEHGRPHYTVIQVKQPPVAVEGSFFSNLKARILDFFGSAPIAVSSVVAERAAHTMVKGLTTADVVYKGEVFRAPPPEPPVAASPSPPPPTAAPTTPPARLGVAQSRSPALSPGMIEGMVLNTLRTLRPGETYVVNANAALGIGVGIDVVDALPIPSEVASKVVGAVVTARAEAGADATTDAKIHIALVNGQVSVKVVHQVGGRMAAAGEAGILMTAGAQGQASASIGYRNTYDYTFATVEDVAKFFAHPIDQGGLVAGPQAAAGQYTRTETSESYAGTELAGEYSEFVRPSQKTSGGILPGIRTNRYEHTVAHVGGPGLADDADRHEMSYSARTYGGSTSAGNPIASEVRLTAVRHQALDAQGQPVFEEPKVSVGLSISKVFNITDGANPQAALDILVDKLAPRLKTVLSDANAGEFKGKVDRTDLEGQLRQALSKLQDRAGALFAEGVTQQSNVPLIGALGFSKMSGDIARLDFSLVKGTDGQYRLGDPIVAVENQNAASFKIAVGKLVKLRAEVGGSTSRSHEVVDGLGVPPVFPHRIPTDHQHFLHASGNGRFYAEVPPGSKSGKLQAKAISMGLPYSDLMAALLKGNTAKLDAVVDGLVTKMQQVEADGVRAQSAQFVAGASGQYTVRSLDRDESRRAIKDALTLLQRDYQTLGANKDKSNFTVRYEGFSVHLQKTSILPFADPEAFVEFTVGDTVREDDDDESELTLVSPLDRPQNVTAMQQKDATVRPDLHSEVPVNGYLVARPDPDGGHVPVIGLQATTDELAAAIRTAGNPTAGIAKWADDMLARTDSFLRPAQVHGQFTGQLDRAQMHRSLVAIGQQMHAAQTKTATMPDGQSLRLQGAGVDVHLQRERGDRGDKVLIQLNLAPVPDRLGRWRLPEGPIVREVVETVKPTLNVDVSGVGFLRATTTDDGLQVPQLGFTAKADQLLPQIDTDTKARAWARTLAADLQSKVVAPGQTSKAFTGTFDRQKLEDSLLALATSLRNQLPGLPPGAATLRGDGIEVALKPRDSNANSHKMTITLTAQRASETSEQWTLPSGPLR